MFKGYDWTKVKREAQARADRLQQPVYTYGDSVNGFHLELERRSASSETPITFHPK